MNYRILFLFFISINLSLFAQQKNYCTREDKAIFDKYVTYIQPFRAQPMSEVMEKTAAFFIGTPYVAHTLEVTPSEELVVNLRALDCLTFVENVIALSRAAKSDQLSFCNFTDELQKIRYRNIKIDDYASRLHYTSDWVFENEKQGVVENISQTLGGVKDARTIDFMSTHTDAYRQLKSDVAMCKKIVAMENELNNRGGFYYLPKQHIIEKSDRIPHMAMLAFATSIKGLDATHVAFAYRKENGELSFIHASSLAKKVVIDNKSLSDYCASQKKCTGIMVMKVEN